MSGSEKRSNLTRRGLLKATGATVGAAALIGGGVLRALGPDEGGLLPRSLGTKQNVV